MVKITQIIGRGKEGQPVSLSAPDTTAGVTMGRRRVLAAIGDRKSVV